MGVACAALGAEHGIGEVLQGGYTPNSVFFNAAGGPSCNTSAGGVRLPAFSILPLIPASMQVVGILVLIWSVVTLGTAVLARLNKVKSYYLLATSLMLLLLGGGYIGPILGISGGVVMYYGRKGEVVASAA